VKIVIIGGGSVLWTPRLGCDFLLEDALDGSELVLNDIDRDAAVLCARYLRAANAQLKKHWKISVAGIDSALKGADLVLVSISTGGFEAMAVDYNVPEKYGVYHTVGDTTGPGGISRSLRNIPVFIDIARKMNKYCPDAWMLHVTNPLTQLTRAVERSGLIRTIGMCHEYTGAIGTLSAFFGVDRSEIDSLCVGVNHFTVLKDLTVKGVKDPMKQLTVANYIEFEKTSRGKQLSGTVDDIVEQAAAAPEPGMLLPGYLHFCLAEKWGFYPLAGCPHVCESLPGINTSPEMLAKWSIYRKGVLPNRPKAKAERRDKVLKVLEERAAVPEAAERSREMIADAAVGLLTGEPRRVIAACANRGQIDDLPRDVTVETWALATRCGIHPVASGKLPVSVKGFMEQIVTEEELTVEAALTGSFDTFVQALVASPMLADKSAAPALAKELLEGNKQYLPQFTKF